MSTSPEQPSVAADRICVSVVVPVYNRSQELRRLLNALANQSVVEGCVEILICDDGSTDHLERVIADAAADCRWPVIRLRQERGGPGAARGLGLAHARGDIVAFTDSDCEPHADWIEQLIRPFDDPAVGIVGGGIDFRRADNLSGRCTNFLMSSALGGGGARNPVGVVHMQYYPRTLNLAVRRELAIAAGGFPSSSHGEDLEFSDRVRSRGAAVRFVPAARVIHHERRSLGQVAREAFLKGVARVRLARRRGMHEFLHALPALLCLYVVGMMALALVRADLVGPFSSPGLVYTAVLGVLAVQGSIAIRSIRALPVLPLYALAMHLGYGTGYLSGWLRVLAAAAFGRLVRGRVPVAHDRRNPGRFSV